MRTKIVYALISIFVALSTLMAAAIYQHRSTQSSKLATEKRQSLHELTSAHFLPANCFLYIQFRDLAQQINNWNRSDMNKRYYQSKSFELWARRHLSLKLSQRLDEFATSLENGVHLDNIPATKGHEAAIAVYDIGGTQIVFTTELDSVEQLSATLLSTAKYQEKVFNNQKYYLANSGGTIQVCYAMVGNRLFAATKEPLLLDTLRVVTDEANAIRLDSLAPLQQLIGSAQEMHDITLWLDQERINKDWYFRHYWIHKNFNELVPFKYGLVDLEIKNDQWTERRFFIMSEQNNIKTSVKVADIKEIATSIPTNVAAYQIESLSTQGNELTSLIGNAILNYVEIKSPEETKSIKSDYAYSGDNYDFNYQREYYDDSDDDYAFDNYYVYTNNEESARHYTSTSYLFNIEIDDPLKTGASEKEIVDQQIKATKDRWQEISTSLQNSMMTARPTVWARFSQDQKETNDLFVTFDHGLIFKLDQPAALDRTALEKALQEMVLFNTVTSTKSLNIAWQSKNIAGVEMHQLIFPLLGHGIAYAVNGNRLIFSNRSEYVEQILNIKSIKPVIDGEQLTYYRVVRPSVGKEAFLKLFKQLDKGDKELKTVNSDESSENSDESSNDESDTDKNNKLAEAFFSGNVGSLLKVINHVPEISFSSENSAGMLKETVKYKIAATPKK